VVFGHDWGRALIPPPGVQRLKVSAGEASPLLGEVCVSASRGCLLDRPRCTAELRDDGKPGHRSPWHGGLPGHRR